MDPDFNQVARPYDFISRIVFGTALIDAQVSSLNMISPGDKILIVGGGTGWILEEIARVHPNGLSITYVEASSKMTDISRMRNWRNNNVNFVNKPIENYSGEEVFDVIITPFFFDLFKPEKIDILFSHLHKMLQEGGFWLYTDFIPPKYQERLWQKVLLKSMYLFFGIMSKVPARQLVDMDLYFTKKYGKISEKWFYKKFIRAVVYRKQ